MGHGMGLFIPDSWTRAFGMSDHLYHLQALLLGAPAGFATLGIGLLIYRRRTVWLPLEWRRWSVLVCAIVAARHAR